MDLYCKAHLEYASTILLSPAKAKDNTLSSTETVEEHPTNKQTATIRKIDRIFTP
jgi:hypothetical protein